MISIIKKRKKRLKDKIMMKNKMNQMMNKMKIMKMMTKMKKVVRILLKMINN